MNTLITNDASKWEGYQKVLFRFFAIYFLLQALPLDWKFYGNLFSINWANLGFGDIFYISRYTPQFVSGSSNPGWGIGTFADWALLGVIALIGAIVWTARDKNAENYNRLYYWLRVILRYRLAIGIIAYGFIKFFPLQAPYPSISNLNTAYGDFNRWKLFSLSLGIVPGYESFLGLVEIIAGLLLLFRRTATFGAFAVVVFTGNVFFSNLAYEGGETVYSLYLITIASFLLVFDALRLYKLVALREPTAANTFKVSLAKGLPANARLALKTAFIFFFVVLYGYKTYAAYHHDVYQFPNTAALPGAAGIYNVSQYRVNGTDIPYDEYSPNRWQDVVFEKWGTISVKSNQAVVPDTANAEEVYTASNKRNYEFNGTIGRIYYNYTVDTTTKVLKLTSRNLKTPERLTLHYTRPDSATIVLSGVRGAQDSVYAQLTRINKKYLLKEASVGRSKALKL
ncbi:hypothetical protein [Mucilaginibacter pedocola]|uniref:DoxX family protein n=1 Tax=Mucilaginibacter pedocola TaxID=1792845 RepID=A0A1S9P756_9SPHI|nr:hypothetical protein [Mucilaginibacter pedocola]OOQ56792.1 hypothetical protein BC343_17555 [Mucilaginibacter pedocola]